MPRILPIALALIAAAAGSAAEGIRVESEGEVRWIAGEGGAGRLVFTGGVRVRRGEATLTAREAEVLFGAGLPASVNLQGEVVYESPAVGLRADAGTMLRSGPGEDDYVVRLERREARPISIRAGEVRLETGGPVVFDVPAGRITLAGRMRAETPNAVMRAEAAEVLLVKHAKPEETEKPADPGAIEGPAAGSEDEKPDARWRLDEIRFDGGIEVMTQPASGPARSARAARAVYSADGDKVVLDGNPPPVVDSTGVSLTAPAITIHLAEGRIESSSGELRAIIRTEERER